MEGERERCRVRGVQQGGCCQLPGKRGSAGCRTGRRGTPGVSRREGILGGKGTTGLGLPRARRECLGGWGEVVVGLNGCHEAEWVFSFNRLGMEFRGRRGFHGLERFQCDSVKGFRVSKAVETKNQGV
jgi:hypothetical protein